MREDEALLYGKVLATRIGDASPVRDVFVDGFVDG